MSAIETTREIENFGRNQCFTPRVYAEPANEAELLEVLRRYRGRQIRVVGRLHSWSAAIESADVVVSMRHFQSIELIDQDGVGSHVWAGAGVQIKHLVARLAALGRTLPSLGLITEQTIAGAISTGTHGSGRQCLSHFVEAVRLACYDPHTGQVTIEEISEGTALRAAQCSLGCLGVILSVKLRCRPSYNVEEFWSNYDRLEQVLDQQEQFPLQQFFLIPWKWKFIAQHRRETEQPGCGPEWLYRIYFFLAIDILLHSVLWGLAKLPNHRRPIQRLFRGVLANSVIRNWRVVGSSRRMLIMEQELFRHIETELFVPRSHLAAALELVRSCLRWAAGDPGAWTPASHQWVEQAGLESELPSLEGVYCHHFPICIRRIIPDQSLISMTSGGTEDWYSISLISYQSKSHRAGFLATVNFVTRATARLFGARPHWGKVVPLTAAELVGLYPELPTFFTECHQRDPAGSFRNAWFQQLYECLSDSPRESETIVTDGRA